jgi:hypothetical protein
VLKKFIRNPKTKTFLAKDGTWTTDFSYALEMQSEEKARKTRDVYNLRDCELYFCLGDTPSHVDFAIPLARLG